MPDLRSFKPGLATRLSFLRGRCLRPLPLASDGDGRSNAFWVGLAGRRLLDARPSVSPRRDDGGWKDGRHGFCV